VTDSYRIESWLCHCATQPCFEPSSSTEWPCAAAASTTDRWITADV